MSYLLPCPQCGAKQSVDSMQAGESTTCSQCGATIEVPSFRDLRRLERAESKPAQRTTVGGGEIARRLVFAVGLILIAGGLMWGSHAGLVRSQLPEAEPLPDHTVQAEAMIDEFPPRETYDLWTDFRDQGLGPYRPPDTYLRQVWGDYYMQRILLGLGVAGIGLLMTVTTSLIPLFSGQAGSPSKKG